MKPALPTSLIVLLGASQSAMAHPGGHDHLGPLSLLDHFVSSPFHVLAWVLGGLTLAGLIVLARRARVARRRDR